MIFNYDTYSGSLKTQTLTIGDELSNKFYGSYPANMGELLSVDWQPSSGNLWLLEINTCILLANTITVFQTGFDCNAISSFVSSSGYNKLHFVKSSYENFESGDNTFRLTLIFLSTPLIISSKVNLTLILRLEPLETL